MLRLKQFHPVETQTHSYPTALILILQLDELIFMPTIISRRMERLSLCITFYPCASIRLNHRISCFASSYWFEKLLDQHFRHHHGLPSLPHHTSRLTNSTHRPIYLPSSMCFRLVVVSVRWGNQRLPFINKWNGRRRDAKYIYKNEYTKLTDSVMILSKSIAGAMWKSNTKYCVSVEATEEGREKEREKYQKKLVSAN